jgi:hypothetical protein
MHALFLIIEDIEFLKVLNVKKFMETPWNCSNLDKKFSMMVYKSFRLMWLICTD